MAPLPMPLNYLEGHFLLFETFVTPIVCETNFLTARRAVAELLVLLVFKLI